MPDDSLTTEQPVEVAPVTPTAEASVVLDPGSESEMTNKNMREEVPVAQSEPAPSTVPNEPTVALAPDLETPAAVAPTSPATEVVTPPSATPADRQAGGELPTTLEAVPTVVTSPMPQSAPVVNLKSLLAKAMETIRFRKNAKLEKIVNFAKEKGSVTNDQAQKLLRVSDATASRYLLELTKKGRVRRIGKTSSSRYEPIVGSNGGN